MGMLVSAGARVWAGIGTQAGLSGCLPPGSSAAYVLPAPLAQAEGAQGLGLGWGSQEPGQQTPGPVPSPVAIPESSPV